MKKFMHIRRTRLMRKYNKSNLYPFIKYLKLLNMLSNGIQYNKKRKHNRNLSLYECVTLSRAVSYICSYTMLIDDSAPWKVFRIHDANTVVEKILKRKQLEGKAVLDAKVIYTEKEFLDIYNKMRKSLPHIQNKRSIAS